MGKHIRTGDDGAIMGGVRMTPITSLCLDLTERYAINTFNTVYAEGDYLLALNDDWRLRLGAQFTDQHAVGGALVANAAGKKWNTQAGGARVQAIYHELTLTTAFSITGSGNTIQSPWGTWPGYLSMINLDFDRAREKAVRPWRRFRMLMRPSEPVRHRSAARSRRERLSRRCRGRTTCRTP